MIQLPARCEARESVTELFTARLLDYSLVVSVEDVVSATEDFIDELCRFLILHGVSRVTFVKPSEDFLSRFLSSYRVRRGKFTVEWRS